MSFKSWSAEQKTQKNDETRDEAKSSPIIAKAPVPTDNVPSVAKPASKA